jgi:hypothetical protein
MLALLILLSIWSWLVVVLVETKPPVVVLVVF